MGKVSSFEPQIGKMKTCLTTNEFTIICPNSYTKMELKLLISLIGMKKCFSNLNTYGSFEYIYTLQP